MDKENIDKANTTIDCLLESLHYSLEPPSNIIDPIQKNLHDSLEPPSNTIDSIQENPHSSPEPPSNTIDLIQESSNDSLDPFSNNINPIHEGIIDSKEPPSNTIDPIREDLHHSLESSLDGSPEQTSNHALEESIHHTLEFPPESSHQSMQYSQREYIDHFPPNSTQHYLEVPQESLYQSMPQAQEHYTKDHSFEETLHHSPTTIPPSKSSHCSLQDSPKDCRDLSPQEATQHSLDLPANFPHHSPQQTESLIDSKINSPQDDPHHLLQGHHFPHNSPCSFISNSPQCSPQESPHCTHQPSSPQFLQHSPLHSYSSHHSLQHSPLPSYSSHHPLQHSSIDVETSKAATQSVLDEEEISNEPQVFTPYTMLSFISDAANAVLDVLVPPLPLEPSSIEASSQIVQTLGHHYSNSMDGSHAQHRLNQHGHVTFAIEHEETSKASINKAPMESSTSKPRKLSSRFFQTPFEPLPKVYTWKETFYMAYQTLGVVYGDLGTSPLYVYPTINVTSPTEQDFLGILSLIFWTLTLIGVVKYTLIVLHADDHGEGGTFAMYTLLCQYANIGQHHGEKSSVEDMAGKRLSHLCKLEELVKDSRAKIFLEENKKAQKVLLFIVMMATCMLVGDGVLTPAISVISAVEGIQTAAPHLSKAAVVIISAIILVLLFILQKHGTHRVSLFFSPVMAMWLITTPLVGVYNIAKYHPGIFKAFSPAHVVYFFKDNGKHAWMMLGGTILCITGAEAMYADMGHFNKRSIQIAFCLMVYPSVLLTYSGQTSYLIAHPQDHQQGFFKMIPKKIFWPMFIISILAAIVASQGLISATFSTIKQAMALEYFPRVKLVHTSDDKKGQIYSPEVNYILMILCLAVIFGFRSSSTIGNAFGVAVTFVMLITTFLTSLVMLVIWRCRTVFVLGFFLLFATVEITYISSVVTKVPQGGWLPFVVALVVTMIMFTWNLGCQAKYRYEMENQMTKQSFGTLLEEMGSVRVPGICFFYTDLMGGVPPIVQHYVSNVRSLHRVLVFTTVRFLPVKTVLSAERFLVGRAGFDGVYRCVARYGYRDVMKIQNNEFLDQFLETLTDYIRSNEDSSRRRSVLSDDDNISHTHTSIDADISVLRQAKQDGAVYVMGRGELKVTKRTKFMTRMFVGHIYRFLRANCRSDVSTMDIPFAQYLEIGMLYDI